MNDGMTTWFDSSQTVLDGLPSLREAIQRMRTCIDRIDQGMDHSEARLTALERESEWKDESTHANESADGRESSTLVRVANKQTGEQPPDSLQTASKEELENLLQLVSEMGKTQIKISELIISFKE
ncbi:hypothetical protein F5Y07DRAFT_397394 [Xylaria sp. FL0933]|nr:hypothetical protein F5Y07DRAFT_397394 [Xylaria sp. FL0933]